MIHKQVGWCSFALFLQSTLLEHGMHILAMEHVVDVTPPLLVIGKVVNTDGLPGPPVAVDELAENYRITAGNINVPFMQPPSAVRSARDRSAHLAGEVVTLVDAHFMTSAAQSNSDGHAADATANDTDVEFSPALRGRHVVVDLQVLGEGGECCSI